MATAVIATSAAERPHPFLPQAIFLLLQRGLVGDRSNSLVVDAVLSLCVPTFALVVVGPVSDAAAATCVTLYKDATEAAKHQAAPQLAEERARAAAAEAAAAKLQAEIAASEARLLNAVGWGKFNTGLFWSALSVGVGVATGVPLIFVPPIVWASWVVGDWWSSKPLGPGPSAKAGKPPSAKAGKP